MPLTNIGPYKVVKPVGCGSYSTVYLCSREGTTMEYALKKLFYKDAPQGMPVQTLHEVQLLKRCNHENIISLYEIVIDNDFIDGTGTISLVFDFMPLSVQMLLSQDINVSVAQMKGYMQQFLTGLSYLEQQQILHLDIKRLFST